MDVKLPKLGEGADSGTVVNVLVKEGDRVEKGQTLVELENEKAVAPIPSSASGVVSSIRVKVGDKLSVGQTILSLDDAGSPAQPKGVAAKEPAPVSAGNQSPAVPAQVQSEPVPAPNLTPSANASAPPVASPSVRRIARELGIDLKRVRGSESGGRIGWPDLKAYVEQLQAQAFAPKPAGERASERHTSPARASSIDFSKWGHVTKKLMSPIRQTISRRMVENWSTVPHVTQFDEADIMELMALRTKYGPAYEAKGVKLTLTPLLFKGLVETLRKHPIFNASLDEASGEIVFKDYFNIGLAVDTDQGLLVPVIRDVDKKSLLELAQEINAMAGRARERKIGLEEMKGGTFTVSNQGGIGSAHFTPIINKPEVAILGLGRSVQKPVVREGRVEPRWLMPVCLSYDHRLIDGGNAVRFVTDLLQAWQQFPEDNVRL